VKGRERDEFERLRGVEVDAVEVVDADLTEELTEAEEEVMEVERGGTSGAKRMPEELTEDELEATEEAREVEEMLE
jgi:regulator of protease activity HflC (stomatin/prohibitin superfamily)